MDNTEERNAKDMTPEEIEAKKKEAIDLVADRINRGDHFLILTEGKGDSALLVGGSVEDLSRTLSITMHKVPQLYEIVDLAKQAYDYAKGQAGKKSSLVDMLGDFKDDLKCETCPGKDDCPIKNGMDQAEGCENPMEVLSKILNNLEASRVTPKGEC